MIFIDQLEPQRDEIISLYQQIHRHPEAGFEEFQTAALAARELRSYGIQVREGVGMTGVLGTLDSGRPGKTILLRADMDSLPVTEPPGCPFASEVPGRMHACGHDGHVAMLLGAAKYLAAHRELFCGRIVFCFQPAEENSSDEKKREAADMGYTGVGGAGLMIMQGALEGVDGCFALHVSPLHQTGSVYISRREAMASSDKFTATIIGRGGHGSAPHKAVDPIGALAAFLDAAHLLPVRETDAVGTCVVSVGTVHTPSSAWNIIPETAVVTGNIRTFDESVRGRLLLRLEELLQGICAAYRCTAKFERMVGYNPTVNDPGMARRAGRVAAALFGEDASILGDAPFMSSEDVGNFFARVPGALIWLGVQRPDKSNDAPLHSPHFVLDPDALVLGSLLHVNLALDFLA